MNNLFKDWTVSLMNLSHGELGVLMLLGGVVVCTAMYFIDKDYRK